MDNKESPSFLGQGWNFPPRFDAETKVLALAHEEEDIRQSLYILFHTEPGERVMNPEYGCALRQFLFENMVLSKLTQMREVINRAILRFEPRITVGQVQVNTEQQLDGILLLEVSYTIRSLNSRHNVVFPFYLHEATLLS
jgi:phage baseplate assembly protein W